MSEQITAGVASIHLRKSRLPGLTAYGIYATKHRLIIVRMRTHLIAVLYLGGILALALDLAGLLGGYRDPSSGVLFLLGLVASVVGILIAFLLPRFVEAQVRKRAPKSVWELEPRDKELELTKEEIVLIEVKLPKSWRGGHVKIFMRPNREFKLRVYQAEGKRNLALTLRLLGVIQSFATVPPSARTLGMTAWTFEP